MIKKIYVAYAHFLGRILRFIGLLPLLERSDSFILKYFASLFAIYDFDAMRRIGLPWWTFNATKYIEQFLTNHKNASVFEYGSGVSSLWLAQRVKELHITEHDANWFKEIEPLLTSQQHVSVSLIQPKPLQANDNSVFISQKMPGYDFEEYATSIQKTDTAYDLIIIDGRARPSCLKEAIHHLKPGGIILFDDTERKRYTDEIKKLDAFEHKKFKGLKIALPYPSETSILYKKETP